MLFPVVLFNILCNIKGNIFNPCKLHEKLLPPIGAASTIFHSGSLHLNSMHVYKEIFTHFCYIVARNEQVEELKQPPRGALRKLLCKFRKIRTNHF